MAPIFSPNKGNQERLSQADEKVLISHEYALEVDAAIPLLRNSIYGQPVRELNPDIVRFDPIIPQTEVNEQPIYHLDNVNTSTGPVNNVREYSSDEAERLRQIRVTVDLEARHNGYPS